MKKAILSWSSGKDGAWTLHVMRAMKQYDVVALVTTFNDTNKRVSIHGVREDLVVRQAAAAGIPLWKIPLPAPCSNEQYEEAMEKLIERAREAKISAIAFGDLFLEDVRAYREKMFQYSGIDTVFPLWGIPTNELAEEMIASGVKAHITCLDPSKLDKSFAGRDYTKKFLADLPEGVDPCGENGEFHTFCYGGPMFTRTIPLRIGDVIEQEGIVYADFIAS